MDSGRNEKKIQQYVEDFSFSNDRLCYYFHKSEGDNTTAVESSLPISYISFHVMGTSLVQ